MQGGYPGHPTIARLTQAAERDTESDWLARITGIKVRISCAKFGSSCLSISSFQRCTTVHLLPAMMGSASAEDPSLEMLEDVMSRIERLQFYVNERSYDPAEETTTECKNAYLRMQEAQRSLKSICAAHPAAQSLLDLCADSALLSQLQWLIRGKTKAIPSSLHKKGTLPSTSTSSLQCSSHTQRPF